MDTRLADLTAERLREWLESERKRRPTYARLAFTLLRACLRWCGEQPDLAGVVDLDAIQARTVREKLPKPRAKDDVLQREQLRAWFGAVRQIGNPVIGAFLQALLLTGARREELLGLRWDDVDFQWRSLTIRDKARSKGGADGTRVIPLTPYVASLLAALPRRNEWVFSSPTAESGRLQEPRAHVKALRAAGLPHVSLHGLRRSFGSLSEWTETPTGIVAQIMGHTPSATAEKHYRVRPLDLLRVWHTRLEAWMLDQAGIEQPAEHTGQRLRVVR